MVITEEKSDYMHYRHYDNGIHELTYKDASRKAVDAFYSYLEKFAQEGQPSDTYFILNDLRESGHQPLSYYFSQLRRVNSQYHPSKRPAACIALVYYSNSPLIGTVDTFIRMVSPRNITIRIFPNNSYDSAVTWLLEERSKRPATQT